MVVWCTSKILANWTFITIILLVTYSLYISYRTQLGPVNYPVSSAFLHHFTILVSDTPQNDYSHVHCIGGVHCQHSNFSLFSYTCYMLHNFSLITFLHKEFWIAQDHVSVTVPLENCIPSDGHIKPWYCTKSHNHNPVSTVVWQSPSTCDYGLLCNITLFSMDIPALPSRSYFPQSLQRLFKWVFII